VGVTVEPQAFAVVEFDAATIARVAADVAAHAGLPPALPIRIVVDEQSMLSQARLRSVDPIVIEASSGAFEDRSRPRRLSQANVADPLARLLQRVADRRSSAFALAPAEEYLTPQEAAAWDVSCLGRAGSPFEARHRYDFSICCGFGPAAQEAFDVLWHSAVIDWAGIAALALVPTRGAAG